MKKKYRLNIRKVILVLLIIIIISLGFVLIKGYLPYSILEKKHETATSGTEPIYQDHSYLFNIKNSNYLERFYERYLAYKEKHKDYSDDTIITYVNIGLDRPFYTNMEETDMSDGILVICNKYHILKSNYVPNLISLDGYGGGQMQKEAGTAFKQMVDDAKEVGITLKNVSGYRSYNTQKNLYNSYVNRDGKSKADTYSARAGSSEHQTGLASDINWVSDNFEGTDAYYWLQTHAHLYGFILRYPKGKTFITGYMYESWHYRYVGKKVAKYIYEHNITYEEYYATFIMK